MAISYVGGKVAGTAGQGGGSIAINSGLTGGSDAAAAAGDLVVVTVCIGTAARTPSTAIATPTGYTPLPKPVVKAAEKVAEKAKTVQAFEAEKPKYAEIFMQELRVTKWLPDYSRAISIALALREREMKRLERERDDEEILLLM